MAALVTPEDLNDLNACLCTDLRLRESGLCAVLSFTSAICGVLYVVIYIYYKVLNRCSFLILFLNSDLLAYMQI